MSILDAITARIIAAAPAARQRRAGRTSRQRSKLAKEIEKLRGVGALFATAGDLQIALRRTQDPPTMPVEMPLR